MQTTTGVIHGRFQILHNDHLAYLLNGKSKCSHLIIGITNPDPTLTDHDASDSQRSHQAANPLTYYERQLLIRASLVEAGVALEEFSIVPMPINYPELLHNYLPTDATYFLSIYDDWGRRKQEILQRLGLSVEILSRRALAEKGLSGTEVRRRIVAGESWRELVPPATYQLLTEWCISDRLRELTDPFSAEERGKQL